MCPSSNEHSNVRRNIASSTFSSAKAKFCPMQFLKSSIKKDYKSYIKYYLGPAENGIYARGSLFLLFSGLKRKGSNTCSVLKASKQNVKQLNSLLPVHSTHEDYGGIHISAMQLEYPLVIGNPQLSVMLRAL